MLFGSLSYIKDVRCPVHVVRYYHRKGDRVKQQDWTSQDDMLRKTRIDPLITPTESDMCYSGISRTGHSFSRLRALRLSGLLVCFRSCDSNVRLCT